MARNKYPEETINLILEESMKLFVEKGYDGTSIQDIINNLGGLSKGAIYHHFKSKEEIFEAVCAKMSHKNTIYYNQIRDDKSKNGFEKLKAMMKTGYKNPNSKAMLAMIPKLLSDPQFLMKQIDEIYNLVVPVYVEPIIREGVTDGSIKTDYPKELAEVIVTLTNIWVNPNVAKTTRDGIKKKLEFFGIVLKEIGVDILDDEIKEQYILYCDRFCLED